MIVFCSQISTEVRNVLSLIVLSSIALQPFPLQAPHKLKRTVKMKQTFLSPAHSRACIYAQEPIKW